MTFPAEVDTVPLKRWDDGSIRVGDTRVHFYLVVEAWRSGLTPEEIAEETFTSLTVPDAYGAIAYALRHPDETERYIRETREQAERLEAEARRRFPQEGLRARLESRRKHQS